MQKKKDHHGSHQLQVWFCEHCESVHFKTANITLDFTKREFLELSSALLEILRNDFTKEDLRQIPNYGDDSDDILFSDTIF